MLCFVFLTFTGHAGTRGGAALSGDYFIPQGGNPQGFATLADAISAANIDGISGTVRFLVDGDLAETGASLLLTRTDFSSTNNLIIKPAPTKTPTITITGCTATAGANQYAGLTLSGCSYVTIDGSNSAGASRDLSLVMNDGTNGRDGIVLYGNCDNVTIKNVKVRYTVIGSTATGRGIYINGQSTGAVDNGTIDNCEIGENLPALVGPHHGIGFTGSSGSSIHCTNGVISNNTLYANIRGINLFWANASSSTLNIYGNTISVLNPVTGNVTWGVLQQTYAGTTNFYGNRVQTMIQKSTGTQGIYGFGTLSGQASAELNIYNNFLGGAFDHQGTGIPASIDVISFQDAPIGAVVRVYYNTVVLNDMTKTASTRMTAMRFNPAAATTFDVRDNIFINNKDAAVAYGVYFGGSTITFTSNYNDIFASGATANVGFATSVRQTLLDWQTASTQDANSVSQAPIFVSATDLHLDVTAVPYFLAGTPIASYTTDFDGQTRSLTSPYMGADEHPEAPLPIQLVSFTGTFQTSGVLLNWRTLSEINNYGFEVQRSADQAGGFVSLPNSFIAGNGTTNQPHSYSFTDISVQAGSWYYRLKQIDLDGSIHYTEPIQVNGVTAVAENVPATFLLSQNYPNPFNPETRISYTLAKPSAVTLTVYTVTGQEIVSLVNEQKSAGRYEVVWNATSASGAKVASGMYFYRIVAKPVDGSAPFTELKKMVLLK